MSTTFAAQINGDDIYAKRAECDAAGNTLSTTYATKSEIPDGVPAVTSSDNNKVLKASYSGGVASYSWQTESGGGGGGSTYTAGDGIDITSDVISADVDGTTIGIDSSTKKIKLLSTIPSVDQTYSAASTNAQSGTAVAGALAGKEDAFDVGTGLEMDTSGATPTLQVETPMDITAGPGIAIDNPDSDTLRVSIGTTFTQAQLNYLKAALGLDETVLYSGLKSVGDDGNTSYTLSETPLNFQYIRVYVCANDNTFGSNGNVGIAFVEWDTQVYTAPSTLITLAMNGNSSATGLTYHRIDGNLSGIRTATWGCQGFLSGSASNAKWFHIYKIVGIHRIANN